MSRDVKALFLLASVVLATTLPFIQRAYFIDDYYFVTMAKGILQNPLRPYDFKSDDAGKDNVAWERGARPRMVNPPLFHYYLAGVIALFGDSSTALRMASLLFSFIALFSMYFLGKRLVSDPLRPALLMALTPAYWLTSYSLLLDGALLGFVLLTLFVFILGQERKSVGWILLSGLLMGLTMLIKYFGVLVIALAFIWQIIDPKRRAWKPGYAAYGVFVAIQLLWGIWNMATYGQMHFLAALSSGMASPSATAWAQKGLVLGSFMGGSLIFVLMAPVMLWRKSKAWLGVLLMGSIGFYFLFSSRSGGFDTTQSMLLSIFLLGTLAYFVLMGRVMKPETNKKDLFLVLWIVLGIVELIVVMPWTASRYLLCVLPAVCWVFAVQIQEFKWPKLWTVALASTALAGLVIAHADYVQANAIVKLSEQLAKKNQELNRISPIPKHQWYYLSDTFDGSQPYMEPIGWKNVMPRHPLKKGDLFLRAYYRRSSYWNVDEQLKKYKPLMLLEIQSRNPVRVMDVPASAGFYASVWGALPWTITNHPVERFELYQAVLE